MKAPMCVPALLEFWGMAFTIIEKRFSHSSGFDRYKPTKADRDIIKKHVSEGVDVEKMGVYRVIASSSRPDSERHVMSKPVLEKMAKDYTEGRTVVITGHDRGSGIGKTFHGEVVQANDGEYELLVKFYVPPELKAPGGNSAKELIDNGVYERASVMVGITGKPDFVKKTIGGEPTIIFKSPRGMSTIHLAVVDMGANENAIMKAAGTPQSVPMGGHNLPPNQNEPQKTAMKYFVKSLGLKGEIEDLDAPSVSALLKEVETKAHALEQLGIEKDTEISTLKKELSGFKSAQETELKDLKARYKNLAKQANKELTAEVLEKKASIYTVGTMDVLQMDIAELVKTVAANKGFQTDPNTGNESGNEETEILAGW